MSEAFPLRIVRDRSGRVRARWIDEAPQNGDFLTSWLESDLQEGDACNRVLEQARAIHDARRGSWSTAGNAFRLLVGPRRVLVSPLFGPDAGEVFRFPTRLLIETVESWSKQI